MAKKRLKRTRRTGRLTPEQIARDEAVRRQTRAEFPPPPQEQQTPQNPQHARQAPSCIPGRPGLGCGGKASGVRQTPPRGNRSANGRRRGTDETP